MNVNNAKHQARLAEWRMLIAQCRSSGLPVKQWCAENGRDPSTYYRWEREIFGRIRDGSGEKTEARSPAARPKLTLVQQPVLAELTVAEPTLATSAVRPEPEKFHAAAVIRVGRLEMELSNAVSPRLMQQLKELVSNA